MLDSCSMLASIIQQSFYQVAIIFISIFQQKAFLNHLPDGSRERNAYLPAPPSYSWTFRTKPRSDPVCGDQSADLVYERVLFCNHPFSTKLYNTKAIVAFRALLPFYPKAFELRLDNG